MARAYAAGAGWQAPEGRRGIAFVQSPAARFGSPAALDSLRRLHDTGANWVALVTPFHSPGNGYVTFYRSDRDPVDEEIVPMVKAAHDLGMHVLLMPQVIADDDTWSGLLQPAHPDQWFGHYTDALNAYAQLAQGTGVDELSIGSELFSMTQPVYSDQWRAVIAAIRQTYHGPLTYSANWGDKKTPEYATIDWWDALDEIGISAYFPLSWNNFSADALRQGWRSYTDPFGDNAVGETFHWYDAIAAVQARWQKPVVFTRIGFASYANSPGRWDVYPDQHAEMSAQANGYEGTMEAWQDTPWLTGLFWTSWSSDANAGGPADPGDTPQNKPAEQVLRQWYGGQP